MNEIYLVNHRPPKCKAFKSITRLPQKEAFEMAAKLYAERQDCDAFNKFGSSFRGYYLERIETEKIMHEKFIALGGNPQTVHPIYFFVHSSKAFDRFYANRVTETIALSEIDSSDICFIIGDSFGKIGENNEAKEPFMKERLMELIAENDNDLDKFLASVKREIGYAIVEALVWNDKYFQGGGFKR